MLKFIIIFIIGLLSYLLFPYYQVIIKQKKYDELKFYKMLFYSSVITTIIDIILILILKINIRSLSFLPIISFFINDLILNCNISSKKPSKTKMKFILMFNIFSFLIFILFDIFKHFYYYEDGLFENLNKLLHYFGSLAALGTVILFIFLFVGVLAILNYLLKRLKKRNCLIYLLLLPIMFFIFYYLIIVDTKLFATANFGYGYEAFVFECLTDSVYIYYIIILLVNMLLLFKNKKVLVYIASLMIFVLISYTTSFHFSEDDYIIHSDCSRETCFYTNDVFSNGNVYFDYHSDDTETSINSYGFYYNIPFIHKIIILKDNKIRDYDIKFEQDKFIVTGHGEKYVFTKEDDNYTYS